MSETATRERDLVLRPFEYAFVSDETKGKVDVRVGPYKASLSNTDKPVIYDERSKRFIPVSLEQSITSFIVADKGSYIILKNPAKEMPSVGGIADLGKEGLSIGEKVNIPGPACFPLWPGQIAITVEGHHLRSNQYLIARVYDEDAAKANWKNSVIKKTGTAEGEKEGESILNMDETSQLTMGKLLIIKGTEVSFYIPPTGIEVISENNQYIRDAVTLETLEYCILLDENGNKRYVRGPAVVFPNPTESFMTRKMNETRTRKFRAIELSEVSGIYIKVIAPYKEGEDEYKEGDELFITGKEQMIYFPRPEHSIVKYGEQDITYAVEIPNGESRYVLDRVAGDIRLVKGPKMFLPDPRKEVIVRRVLDPEVVKLMYPTNTEALSYNTNLKSLFTTTDNFIADSAVKSPSKGIVASTVSYASSNRLAAVAEKTYDKGLVADEIKRSSTYTKPRTITLDSKYDGAVKVNVWTGYAIKVINGKGESKIITGPAVYHLEFDEYLEKIFLSTGKPKTTNKLLQDVYLKVLNNKIGDLIYAESKDFVKVGIKVSYRVNFEGDPNKWFNVDNYVKFLCDNMRSMVGNRAKQFNIEELYGNYINIVRDLILGESKDGKREGRFFTENGMKIYDVEVLDLLFGDAEIKKQLEAVQKEAFNFTIQAKREERAFELLKLQNAIYRNRREVELETAALNCHVDRKTAEDAAHTATFKSLLESEVENQKHAYELLKETNSAKIAQFREEAKAEIQDILNEINAAEILREEAKDNVELKLKTKESELKVKEAQGIAEAEVSKHKAIEPELVAALTALGNAELISKVSEHLAPLAIVEGKSIGCVLMEMFKGTSLEKTVSNFAEKLGPKVVK